MEVVAIISRKGGVGKTATAHALGAGLMAKKKKVLYIDLDSQTNLTHSLAADPSGPSSMDLLTGECEAKDAIQTTAQGDIIPAAEALATADKVIDDTGKEYRLKEAIDGLKYDYIIIDTPAALGTLTINALTAATSVIIPVQADIYSLQGIAQLDRSIQAVRKYCNKRLSIRGILITRYASRSVLSRDMRENIAGIAQQLKTRLYSTPIRECVAVKEAQARQTDLYSYAPKSNAAKDYTQFVCEFLEGGK